LDELSARTDVYLLGATLHYVLTGQYRNKGGDLIEVLKSAQRTAPFEYAASVPRELAELANRSTAHDPADRPPSAAAFREALAEYLAHRGSLSLATAASERLGELLRERASPDHVRLVQTAGQARFGFELALEQWPENPVAREGREACLIALAEIELERENVSGARAALAELTKARPDLAERARELEQKLATRARSEERLKQLEHAADVGISRSGRRLTVLIILVATTASSVALLSGGELRYRDVLLAGASPLAVVLIAGVVFRERLLANALGRKLFGLLLGASLLLFLHRVASWYGGVTISAMLRDQLFILSMAGFAGGLLGVRSWFSASALALLGAFAASVIPDRTTEIFAATVLVGGVLISVEPLRRERSPSPR
jgi:eukaryotic-like serine/threonine-protein kinase